MYEIRTTKEFDRWYRGLQDEMVQLRIGARFRNVARGHFGDWKPVGNGVVELRFHFGPGFRVYFTRVGREIVFLLAGGDKSTQTRDIANAIRLAGLDKDHG